MATKRMELIEIDLRKVIDAYMDQDIRILHMSKPDKEKIIKAACELAVDGISMLSREDLVEQMADQIEDEISNIASTVRADAERDGVVDDEMYEEALDDAISRVKSWG